MNDYVLSALLGIVEGLTEFLPISSTAHLRIVEALAGGEQMLADPYWKMFTVFIQLGAILAVVFYFRQRIGQFLSTFPRGESGGRTWLNHPLSLVLIAFFVTAIPAFVLSKLIKHNLESLWIIGGALLVGGIIMWIVDVAMKRPRTAAMEAMTLPQAILIGAAQILSAVFPGTSRSMSTIAAGQLVGLSRPAALEFSFFLSIPIMFAACSYDLLKTLIAKPGDVAHLTTPMDAARWIQLGIGFLVSFIVAWWVIGWFMTWVRRHGFVPFAIYRIVLGVVVLIWASQVQGG